MSPYDRPLLAVLRFSLEFLALLAIMLDKGLIGVLSGIAALALFATPGDKRFVLVKVPGTVRAMIELVVFAGAVEATWGRFGPPAALGFTAIICLYLYLARGRLLWLLRGAPAEQP